MALSNMCHKSDRANVATSSIITAIIVSDLRAIIALLVITVMALSNMPDKVPYVGLGMASSSRP
jgi:hypothetical protein